MSTSHTYNHSTERGHIVRSSSSFGLNLNADPQKDTQEVERQLIPSLATVPSLPTLQNELSHLYIVASDTGVQIGA